MLVSSPGVITRGQSHLPFPLPNHRALTHPLPVQPFTWRPSLEGTGPVLTRCRGLRLRPGRWGTLRGEGLEEGELQQELGAGAGAQLVALPSDSRMSTRPLHGGEGGVARAWGVDHVILRQGPGKTGAKGLAGPPCLWRFQQDTDSRPSRAEGASRTCRPPAPWMDRGQEGVRSSLSGHPLWTPMQASPLPCAHL